MKKFALLSVVASMLTVVGCSSSNTSAPAADKAGEAKPADVKVMKLSVVTPKERSLTQGLYKFGEILEKETNGSIKVEVYPDGQLGGDRQAFEGMKLGTIQGSTMSSGPIAAFEKKFNVLDLPFLFSDSATAYKTLDGSAGQELLDALPATGVVGINYWENGFRHLTTKNKEVKTVDDIKGIKIRTLENPLHVDMWKELGAFPTPMAFTELFTALEQGVVDGQENPAGNVKASKFNEVQKNLTKTGHVYNASVFLVSKKFYDTLSDTEKAALKKAADQARDYQRELNQKEDKESFEYLAKNGMKINELSDEEKKKFVEKVQPVYNKYAEQLGEDLVKKFTEAK